MEEINNIEMAVSRLKDEIQGVMDYERMHSMVSDPELKKIFHNNMEIEKQHAKVLLNYLSKSIDKVGVK